MPKLLTRIYPDYAAADLTIKALKSAGLGEDDISILASNAAGWHRANGDNVDPKYDKDRDGRDDRAEGAATGAGIGALAGGAAVGLGLIAVPGVGPVVAFGWLAVLAGGTLTAGAAGGIIGALVESGVSKENADIYAEALRRGGAVVTARVPDEEEGPYGVLMDNSALDPTNLAASYRRAGWEGFDAASSSLTSGQARREQDDYRR